MGNYSLDQPKKIFFILLLSILLAFEAINVNASSSEDENLPNQPSMSMSSLRGVNRFLAENSSRATMTCDKYPRTCRAKGSSGPDCCKKRCVNSLTDKLNCGKCGNKCKFSEICCKGKCVNSMFDEKNCGGCSNKCKKGSQCVYGMCSYA
ncbi:Stigma-specific Stig1 family protein [Euphorbia peplus]|nr:Stigma-specific Stig1 family protein [Euphorbia peplus]